MREIEDINLLNEVKYYNHLLYEAEYYGEKNKDDIWNLIKDNKEVLNGAINITKNKWNEDTLYGRVIAEEILNNYNDVPSDIYEKLIKIIYSNKDIAKTTLNLSHRGYSFLLLTFHNPNLKLTEEQKKFAQEEAITNYNAHGVAPFDIRYHILMNDNFSITEKADLIYDFYEDDNVYNLYLDMWEWSIINSDRVSKNLNANLLNEYSRKDLDNIYNNKSEADKIYEEITMCKLFHDMRPRKWEITLQDNFVYTKK